jgi:filamentous hemagglutinin family protein
MARRRDGGLLLGLALSLTLLGPALGRAEVATDGTLGAKVRLTGRDVKVPARLGQIRGKNLFHSFQRFGIETGGKVTFTGPDGLKNVIGRVTGGKPSSIDGTLASKIRGADLWLLNPAGLLFGPHAHLDVLGSFHASTADELRFAGGAVFSALDPQGSVLSVAPPAAFGFLGAKPGGITVDQSVLEVPEGKALSLVGGDITVRGNHDGVANSTGLADEPGTMRAKAGRVSLAALGGPGAVMAGTNEITGAVSGEIHLSGEASVISNGDGGGAIRIRGGRLVVEDTSFVLADNLGASHAAGGVTVEADSIEIRGGLISADTKGRGNAGEVSVAAGRLRIDDAGAEYFRGIRSIASDTSVGNAGRVVVTADTIDIHGGGLDSSTFRWGDAGEVTVTAKGHLRIDRAGSKIESGIRSNAGKGSFGDAGHVAITAGTIDIRNGGQIRSSANGQGNAGKVTVTATDQLRIDDAGSEFFTGIVSWAETRSEGDAGQVKVTANFIEIRGDSSIGSSTFGPRSGNAGEVMVTAKGQLRIDATGSGSEAFTGIASQGFTGDAGQVTVTADTIDIHGDGSAGSNDRGDGLSTATFGPGNAGKVIVAADTIELRDGSQIGSSTFGPRSGNAGEVVVKAGYMTVADKGTVETNSTGSGTAGNVFVQASHLKVRDGGEIGSSGTGSGPAGNLHLDVGTLEVEDASIRTEGKVSEGGQIEVMAEDLIHLQDAEVTSSGIEPAAGTSVITLQAPLIALNDSRVTSLTGGGVPLAGSGLARLFGDTTVISSDSVVAASSSVTLTGAEGDAGSRLVVPEGAFLNVGDLLRESCAARRSGTASSFTAMGQGGLPLDPAGPLAAFYREQGGATATGQAGPALAANFGEGCKAAPGG